jgi:hypothetical protein
MHNNTLSVTNNNDVQIYDVKHSALFQILHSSHNADICVWTELYLDLLHLSASAYIAREGLSSDRATLQIQIMNLA